MKLLAELRTIRLEQKLSQDAVACSLGYNATSAISNWESGNRAPSLGNLTKWADALGYELKLEKKL